jgi:hypothetical protein
MAEESQPIGALFVPEILTGRVGYWTDTTALEGYRKSPATQRDNSSGPSSTAIAVVAKGLGRSLTRDGRRVCVEGPARR